MFFFVDVRIWIWRISSSPALDLVLRRTGWVAVSITDPVDDEYSSADSPKSLNPHAVVTRH